MAIYHWKVRTLPEDEVGQELFSDGETAGVLLAIPPSGNAREKKFRLHSVFFHILKI